MRPFHLLNRRLVGLMSSAPDPTGNCTILPPDHKGNSLVTEVYPSVATTGHVFRLGSWVGVEGSGRGIVPGQVGWRCVVYLLLLCVCPTKHTAAIFLGGKPQVRGGVVQEKVQLGVLRHIGIVGR